MRQNFSLPLFLLFFLPSFYTISQTTSKWKQLGAGYYHSIGIKEDGTLWGWGENSAGQLGNGSKVKSEIPKQIGTDTDWTMISVGHTFNMAVKADSTLWVWGNGANSDNYGDPLFAPIRLGIDSNWVKISAGYYNAYGIKSDGSLWSWGGNLTGELGTGDNMFRVYELPAQIGTDLDWKDVYGIHQNAFAVKNDSSLWGWGSNGSGKVGDGSYTNRFSPVHIQSGSKWISIAGSGSHSMGVQSDGTLWTWGTNFLGQLGFPSAIEGFNTPQQVGEETSWRKVTGRTGNCLAIKSDSSIWRWGHDGKAFGEPLYQIFSPILVSRGKWTHVEASYYHALAMEPPYDKYCAIGFNNFNQIGIGSMESYYADFTCNNGNALHLEEIKAQRVLEFYPNPTSDKIYFLNSSDFSIKDLQGNEIMSGKDADEVDLKKIIKGCYLLTQNGVQRKLFIIP